MASARRRPPPRRVRRPGPLAGRRRPLLIALGLVVAAGVCLAVVFGYQAVKAKQSLQLAASQAQRLQNEVAKGDVSSARGTLRDLQASTTAAQSHTGGPLWDLGGHVPLIGDSVSAVQAVSEVLRDLSRDGLGPIIDAADSIDTRAFSPRDGKVDVRAITKLAPALSAADRSLTTARKRLARINDDDVVGPLKAPVKDLQGKVATAQSASATGSRAARLMPAMLGSEGTRSYLLVFQNNAEIRSTGGMPGAFALVETKAGRVSLRSQGAASDLERFESPVVKLSKDEESLYTTLMASYWADTTFTPDFPRTGQIMRKMYEKKFGDDLDGVISVDPIALSFILRAIGPIELADGTTLTRKNAVDVLLNRVYLRFPDDGAAQNALFADAAARVFDAVASGKGDPQALVRQMTKASSENRLLVWSARDDEQEILSGTRVAGELPGDSGATPHVGVYLNDSTATKLQYYLRHKTTMHTESCTAPDVQTIEATTVLRSTAPRRAKGLPPSILGPSRDAQKGAMKLNVRIYAPHGGSIDEVSVDDELQTVLSAKHQGRSVTVVPVRIKPGQTVTVRTVLLTGRNQPKDPVLSVTPTVSATPNNLAIASACRR